MKVKSRLMDRVPASATLGVADIARRLENSGRKMIHFELGEPDFTTPENIIQAAYEKMREGKTHYVPSRGIPELCEAIAKHIEDFGIHADPEKNIVVVPGSKFAIYALLSATIDPDDEVIIVSPSWPSLIDIVRIVRGNPVLVPLDGSLHLDEEKLKKAVTNRTQLLILNSPNNPTGGVLNAHDLGIIRDLAIDEDFLVLSDEIYKMMVYDGAKHLSPASLPDMLDRTIIVDGFSKTYAMTGWRIAYAIGNERIIDNIVKIQENTTTCAVSFAQYAAVEALNGPQDSVRRMLDEYSQRRNTAMRLIREMPGVKCVEPSGAFYLFPNVSSFGKPDTDIARDLLESGVSLTAGTPFGLGGNGHLRISYSTGMADIVEGMRRMREYFKSL